VKRVRKHLVTVYTSVHETSLSTEFRRPVVDYLPKLRQHVGT
jgi:hypothetical protein